MALHLVTSAPETSLPSVTAAPRGAAAELASAAPDRAAVVAWLSAHLAAVEHVVYPVARRVLPAADLATQVELTRRIEHVLLQLHQALQGDGRASAVDSDRLATRLVELLDTHLEGLQALLARMDGGLPAEQRAALTDRYHAALRTAPTRPHPHTPHGSVGERIAFVVAGAVDRLLDALDSRVAAPIPAPREAGISAAKPA